MPSIRPKYHFTPMTNWMNDPNGLCFHDNYYHLYYQYNPNGKLWGCMHWGHAISKDMLTWQHKDIALKTDSEYDRDGCFSGSAIEVDNKLHLFYTGVKYNKIKCNSENNPIALQADCFTPTQIHAISNDGGNIFEKISQPAVTTDVRYTHRTHVRDPKVWKTKDGFYRMVLGNTENYQQGSILFYKSYDLNKWDFEGKWISPDFGWGWECPDFFELDGYDVLVFSPMGVRGGEYQNVSMYLIGRMDFDNFVFHWEKKGLIDEMYDMYAPQTFVHNNERFMIGWIRMTDSFESENYTGMMSIPRKLSIKNHSLCSNPIEAIKNKRTKEIYNNISNSHLLKKMPDVYDMEVYIKNINDTEIIVCADENKNGFKISYNKKDSSITADRENVLNNYYSFYGIIHKKMYVPYNESLSLRIIVDVCIIEVFINDGEKTLSVIINKNQNQNNIFITSSSEVDCRVWNI